LNTSGSQNYNNVEGGNGGREAYELYEAGVEDTQAELQHQEEQLHVTKPQGSEDGLRMLAMMATSSSSTFATSTIPLNGSALTQQHHEAQSLTARLELLQNGLSVTDPFAMKVRLDFTQIPVLKGRHGNFALSSCPGKKVRLQSGPVNGRGKILLLLIFATLSCQL
jgi:hypothetical protein